MISLVIIYAAVFVVGPLAFFRLMCRQPTTKQFARLGCIVAGATGMSFALRYLSDDWGQGILITYASIALIWLAWIAILAFVAQTLRQHDEHPTMRRWTALIGALATTIPWFGLASARTMFF